VALTVQESFEEFIKKISISCDCSNKIEERTNLVIRLLSNKFDVLEIFAVGSLVTYTAIKDYVNIDIIVVLHYSKYIRKNPPLDLLKKIKRILNSYKVEITKNNTHAVKLKFKSAPNVNIIPASRVSVDEKFSHYNIPSTDKDIWIASNPKIHTQQMRDLSIYKGQLVQIIKEWNRQNLSYLSSFHIDNMALTYKDDVNLDFAWHICKFFKHMYEVLENKMLNPNGLGSYVDDYLDEYSRVAVLELIDTMITKIYNAWYDVYSDKPHKLPIETYCECFGDRFPKYG